LLSFLQKKATGSYKFHIQAVFTGISRSASPGKTG